MKIMIIGGSGNISGSIVRALLRDGHEVVCFNRGLNKWEPLPAEVRQIHGDRHDRQAFEAAMQGEAPDAAIDMFCFTRQDAESDLRAFPHVQRLLFCSTACVYGVAYDVLPVPEDHPLRPNTPYGRGKAEAEAVFLAAWYERGYPITILRPSTTYGNQVGMVSAVGQNSVWIDRVLKGKPLLLPGSGNTPHQFMHVDDAAEAFVGALYSERCLGQVYNLAYPGYTEWRSYYRTGMEILGREVPLLGVPLDILEAMGVERFGYAGDIFAHNAYYSHQKLARDLPGFAPKIGLREGMARVIDWCTANGAIPNSDDYPLEDTLAAGLLAEKSRLAALAQEQ